MTAKEERPRGLGRGLSALIGDEAAPTRSEAPKATRTLPVAFLRPGKFQPRKNFADDALADLAASVKEKGVLTPILVRPLGAFVFGWPSIVAVILNYAKRGEARGTWIESHFRWQIRTFWFGLLWCAIGAVLALTVIGIPLAVAVFVAAGLWVIYRIVRGWLALGEGKALSF